MNPTRLKKYREAKSRGWTRIFTEGDSWFNYPAEHNIPGYERDVTEWLRSKYHYAVLGFERFGDELLDMVAKREFASCLRKEKPRALLLSGGGNDILEKRLKDLIKCRGVGPVENSVNWDLLYQEVLPELEKAYLAFLADVDALLPGMPIVTHGYAYARPSDRGAKIFWKKVAGPWLKPALMDRDFHDPAEQRYVIALLIDALNELQQGLAARFPGRFIHVDLRKMIKAKDWHDEIHLKADAYRRVAAAFHAVIKKL